MKSICPLCRATAEGVSPTGDWRRYDCPACGSFEISGTEMLARACLINLEGVISKRRDAPYRSGRSDDWIKSKCGQAQEFIIVGYKDASHLKGQVEAARFVIDGSRSAPP